MNGIKSLRICVFAFALFVCGDKVSCQIVKDYNDNIAKYSLSSPDVYSFEKYSLNPANHHVGKLNISVPIYTIKTGNIEYPLTLSYNTGGIKVDQLASNVGLGWTLSSALISRTVNGDNDFDNTGSLSLMPTEEFDTYSALDKSKDMNAWTQNGYTGKVGYMLQKQQDIKITESFKSVDFLPDQYNFYSNSYSTSFFFDNFNSVKELNPKGTKIEYIIGKRTVETNRGEYNLPYSNVWTPWYNLPTKDLLSIIITTNDGIKYTFSDCDYTISQKWDNFSNLQSPAQVSAWHISKIEDLNTGKAIDFEYETTSSNPNHFLPATASDYSGFYLAGAQRSYEYVENPAMNIEPGCSYYVPYTSSEGTYKLNLTARVDVELKRLKKIIYDQGQIVFNYNNEGIGSTSGVGRNDIYNGDFVSQIYIKDLNLDIVKSFNFNYTTFNSSSSGNEFNPDGFANPYRYKRLKLISFGEEGKPTYKFSYDETVNLPPINSFSVDFLGYYNGSRDVTTTSVLTTTRPNPKLYYYPNQFEKSLLPFPIAGLDATVIPGIFDRQANSDYAKAWSLNKIEYPTGGSSQYVYESNKFELLGQTIDGGGIRVAQQLLTDVVGNPKTINYTYNNSSGTTSGSLFSIPYFGHATTKLFDVVFDYQQSPAVITSPTPPAPSNLVDWKLYEKSNLNADISTGAYVGYSDATEEEPGLGRKEFSFTSSNILGFSNELNKTPRNYPNVFAFLGNSVNHLCILEFLIANSGFGSNVFTDNSYKRGKLLEERVYNNANQLINKSVYTYQDNVIATADYTQGFTQPFHVQGEENATGPLFTARKKYKIAQYLPSTKTTTVFDEFGFNPITETLSYTYNANGLIKTQQSLLSNGKFDKAEYYYPTDVSSTLELPGTATTVAEKSAYLTMANNVNNVSEKIQVNHYTNNFLKSYSRKTFKMFTSGVISTVVPESVKAAKSNNPLENSVNYNFYDDARNVTQYTQESGVPVTLIWGYNKTKLIAKIDNLAMSDLPSGTIASLQTLSNADFDHCTQIACKEQSLRVALNNLRVLLATTNPTAMVTTYTYDPLVGITSITDAKGTVQYYFYDDLQRLKLVKDKDGNVVSENQYHYKQ